MYTVVLRNCKIFHSDMQQGSMHQNNNLSLYYEKWVNGEFFSFSKGFYWNGSRNKDKFFILVTLKIGLLSRILAEDLLNHHQCYLVWEVYFGDELQDVKLQVWIDQMWSEYIQHMLFGCSSFCINWYWYWIFQVDFYYDWVYQSHLNLW